MRDVVVLNVAEKPSVARALAQTFARMPGARNVPMQRDVHQIFTSENVQFPPLSRQGQGVVSSSGPTAPHTMITTSVRGHLANIDFGPAQRGWSNCDPRVLFDVPLVTQYSQDMEPLRNMLQRLARNCQAVILWLDCDREGEAIGAEVRTVVLEGNGRLDIFRARFSTVLPAEIHRALKSLGRLNEHFVQAVKARSELDLRVGAAFTRFQTMRLQRKFDDFSGKGVVSYGPCQFPTLGFVVERWARIETFVPETFWSIELSIQVDGQQPQTAGGNSTTNNNYSQARSRPIHFQWKRGRLYDQTMTACLYESCLDAEEAVVTHVQGRPKNKWRPVPLATIELQKKASRYLRLGSETLMTAAEELYNAGLISYPRTETEKFRPEFQHFPLIQSFAGQQGEFGDYASRLLTNNNFQTPRAGRNDDQAHPPITPCKAVDPATIADHNQRGVYTLVVKHYLACCSRDAVGRETQLTVRMASEEFTAKGLMVLEKNWLEIYAPWERWSTGQGELPPLQIGSRFRPTSLMMKESQTTAPLPISEVELISAMDRNGIGTDATIAQHISTIQAREYATKDASMRFLPTKLGIALVEAYNSMGYQLNKPDLRRETEAECNDVAAGRKSKDQIMASLIAKMRQCYEMATREATKLDEAIARHFSRLGSNNDSSQVLQANFSLCGNCGSQMALKQSRSMGNNSLRSKLLYCNSCRTGWGLPRGNCRPKTEGENGGPPVKCPICNFQVLQMLRGEGYEGNGYHVCPHCFNDPPAEHGGPTSGGEFRCFTCQHPTCTLATGTGGVDAEVLPCPFCDRTNGGIVCLRKTARGYVLSCNNYSQTRCPYSIWLPKQCDAVTVVSAGDENADSPCRTCSSGGRPVLKIKMVFKPGSVPSHLGRECCACLICDTSIRRDLEVSLPQRGSVVPRAAPRAQQRGTATNRNRNNNSGRSYAGRSRGQQNRNGGSSCYKCGQPGHFANQCPN